MRTIKFYHNPGRLLPLKLIFFGVTALALGFAIISGLWAAGTMLLNLILETKN